MVLAEALGDEDVDELAEQLVAPVAEEPLRLAVDEHDPPAARCTMTMASGAASRRPRNRSSIVFRPETLRIAAAMRRLPSSVLMGLRLISAGNSEPSRPAAREAAPRPSTRPRLGAK